MPVTNILCQTKRLFAFSKIGFCAGTKVFEEALNAVKFLGWLKTFGPAKNILGPVKGQGISLPNLIINIQILNDSTVLIANFRVEYYIFIAETNSRQVMFNLIITLNIFIDVPEDVDEDGEIKPKQKGMKGKGKKRKMIKLADQKITIDPNQDLKILAQSLAAVKEDPSLLIGMYYNVRVGLGFRDCSPKFANSNF